jgi:hypothetical protein
MSDPARSVPSMPGVMASAMRIFDLSLGQMLWSRRSVFLGVLLGGPVLLAVILRIVDTLHASGFRVNGAAVGGSTIFGMMIWLLFIRFIVPVLGVFYGTSLIADEVEDKTITYLFTRPIPRRSIVMGKFIAYLLCAASMVLPSASPSAISTRAAASRSCRAISSAICCRSARSAPRRTTTPASESMSRRIPPSPAT